MDDHGGYYGGHQQGGGDEMVGGDEAVQMIKTQDDRKEEEEVWKWGAAKGQKVADNKKFSFVAKAEQTEATHHKVARAKRGDAEKTQKDAVQAAKKAAQNAAKMANEAAKLSREAAASAVKAAEKAEFAVRVPSSGAATAKAKPASLSSREGEGFDQYTPSSRMQPRGSPMPHHQPRTGKARSYAARFRRRCSASTT